MARPDRSARRREEFLPVIARTFAANGYRRATTAALAKACGVRENILYRLWTDKKSMFIAAIDYVFANSTATWGRLLDGHDESKSAAERLLDYESRHHGEFALYRIIFAGLSETDDPEIMAALRAMYDRFHRFIQRQIRDHREQGRTTRPTPALAAWAIVGLGTVANITNELGLLSERSRRRLIADVGKQLLGGEES